MFKSDKLKVYLIRHAEIESNLRSLAYDNKQKEGLTREGKKQAKKLARKLNKVKIDKIFISEAQRTYETISPLTRLKKGIPIKKDKRLNECKFGIFSGLSSEEAKKKYPKIFKAREKNKWSFSIPKGESYKDVVLRLESFLRDLKKESKKSQFRNVLIVTHATPIKVFLIKYLGFNIKKVDSIYFKNTSISVFDFQNENIKPIKINDCSHVK